MSEDFADTFTDAPLVTIFGGSGFIGRHIAQRMARRGWRVRVAVRRPNEALFVKPYGVVGQVVPVQANIRDEASCRRAIAGSDAVIYSIGLLYESRFNKFEDAQAEGPGLVARLVREAGARRFALISAIGADADSDSDYARTKAEGEAAARAVFPETVILRPSVVFGQDDGFLNKFADLAQYFWALPITGGSTKFQPVYVDDVAEAAALAASGHAEAGATYELGGPRMMSLRECIDEMMQVIKRRIPVFDLPGWSMKPTAWFMEWLGYLGVNPPITRDQIKLLKHDNVVADDAKGLADLGIAPTGLETVMERYLWAYRPYGQYARITGS